MAPPTLPVLPEMSHRVTLAVNEVELKRNAPPVPPDVLFVNDESNASNIAGPFMLTAPPFELKPKPMLFEKTLEFNEIVHGLVVLLVAMAAPLPPEELLSNRPFVMLSVNELTPLMAPP